MRKDYFKLSIATLYNDNTATVRYYIYDNINQTILMKNIFARNKKRDIYRKLIKDYRINISYI